MLRQVVQMLRQVVQILESDSGSYIPILAGKLLVVTTNSWSGPLLLERESTRVTAVYRAVTTDNAAVTAPTLLQW